MADMISVFAYRVQSPFENIARAIISWNRAKKTRNALQALSARQLEDIGIERCDIERIAAGRF